jgi:methionyl-tRNA formyltransferase
MATVLDITAVNAEPGSVVGLNDGIQVACGTGVLNISELQAPGGKRMNAQAFAQGHHLKIGDKFTTA